MIYVAGAYEDRSGLATMDEIWKRLTSHERGRVLASVENVSVDR